jgi:hypothetical protein
MVHLNLSVTPSNRRKKLKGEKGYYNKGYDTKKEDNRQFSY